MLKLISIGSMCLLLPSFLFYQLNSLKPNPQLSKDLKAQRGSAFNQTISSTFVGIMVVKLDSKTDTLMDNWETINYCEYKVNSSHTKLSFKENKPKGALVRQWEYDITSFDEDEGHYIMKLERPDVSTFSVVIWKDHSMVVLEETHANYLVTGHVQSANKSEK